MRRGQDSTFRQRLFHLTAIALMLALALTTTACAHGPEGVSRARRLAGIGAGVALVGGTTWAVGDRRDSNAMMIPGMVAVAVGLAAILAAGGIIAGSVSCQADADCPTGHACREIPAAAGRLPYSQCVNR